MALAISILLLTIAIITVIFILKTIKKVVITLLAVVILSTIGLCVAKPALHKPFSINVIDYLIKFNTDGSVTTIKQTTTTQIKESEK